MTLESGPIYLVTFPDNRTVTFRLIGGKELEFEIFEGDEVKDVWKGDSWLKGWVTLKKITCSCISSH